MIVDFAKRSLLHLPTFAAPWRWLPCARCCAPCPPCARGEFPEEFEVIFEGLGGAAGAASNGTYLVPYVDYLENGGYCTYYWRLEPAAKHVVTVEISHNAGVYKILGNVEYNYPPTYAGFYNLASRPFFCTAINDLELVERTYGGDLDASGATCRITAVPP